LELCEEKAIGNNSSNGAEGFHALIAFHQRFGLAVAEQTLYPISLTAPVYESKRVVYWFNLSFTFTRTILSSGSFG
jgi:hypothetical protein